MSAPRPALRDAVTRLADRCRQCYQCGQCTSSCPLGWDLGHGPRTVIRLVLAEQLDELLRCDDVWRCSGCATCTASCPMEVPVHEVIDEVRRLELQHGSQRCPERTAAGVATWWLGHTGRIDNLVFGAAVVGHGHVPRDPKGTAAQGAAAAYSLVGRASNRIAEMTRVGHLRAGRPPGNAAAGAPEPGHALPFFTGCALPQDPWATAATRRVARDLGVCLEELRDAGCCGHPSRGTHAATLEATGPVYTVCPACDASLRQADVDAVPVWEKLLEQTRRSGRTLRGAAASFVPYLGCLVDRRRGMQVMEESAALSDTQLVRTYPALHSACCGGLGAIFRGRTRGSRDLVDFAAKSGAPVVTTCLLCRDNIRSAARCKGAAVAVYFWPEFFSVARRPTGDAGLATVTATTGVTDA